MGVLLSLVEIDSRPAPVSSSLPVGGIFQYGLQQVQGLAIPISRAKLKCSLKSSCFSSK